MSTQVKKPIPPAKVQPVTGKPVPGFFSQYVPRQGLQYYRDLAGNIKQVIKQLLIEGVVNIYI